jgi:hypothetical protein
MYKTKLGKIFGDKKTVGIAGRRPHGLGGHSM